MVDFKPFLNTVHYSGSDSIDHMTEILIEVEIVDILYWPPENKTSNSGPARFNKSAEF